MKVFTRSTTCAARFGAFTLEPCSWQSDTLPSGSIVRRRIIFPWCVGCRTIAPSLRHIVVHRPPQDSCVAGATTSACRDSQQYDRRCTANEVCDRIFHAGSRSGVPPKICTPFRYTAAEQRLNDCAKPGCVRLCRRAWRSSPGDIASCGNESGAERTEIAGHIGSMRRVRRREYF